MHKRHLIPLLLIAGVAILITITRAWVLLELEPTAAANAHVSVSGSEGNAALMPVAIALLAIGLVLSIAGRVLRVVLGLLATVFGAWIAWQVWADTQMGESALIDFAGSTITEATGLVTDRDADLIVSLNATLWPLVTIVLGVLVMLVGVAVIIFGWRWQKGGSRYEARKPVDSSHRTTDRISDWDALSGGEDPSDWDENPRSS